ncbi:LysR substrate-binding domain-containing protein [Paracoccus saliphilus]|uniref:LysR family transcriptional regulator n=1 Tax=Paracoccus saliphilus TaxID=405559 RepID=A0AA46A7D4_9RHOB|nr:LysR substrate-binding domain-containing protein [Paracoccus saliphilus]WCR01583.1 LysR family transcriptional regulator [Paracoccus saliphilus]SIT12186.1 LysR family transcriptional regulator, nitrogen assimilation regulatory protein [Paracoccus saliphilus]
MDIRRLYAFVKIVDIGSITRASTILHIAQPALSQQIASLETHFGKPLLLRSKRGVVPTEAGKMFYRHCQTILRQMEQAELDIMNASGEISGHVSVGLAPLGLGALVASQLIESVQETHPGIKLYINENVGGGIISEMIMTGKMDVALIFDPGRIPTLAFDTICTEELHYVTTSPEGADNHEIAFADAVAQQLILPSQIHTLRQAIDTTLARAGLAARVAAQTESISILSNALSEGLGAAILPLSAARAVQRRVPDARALRIRRPNMKVSMVTCVSGQLPLSEAANIVHERLVELAKKLTR